MGNVGRGAEANAAAVEEAAALLAAQDRFYDVLTSGAAEQMGDLWDAAPDASVSEALAEGARVEPWRAGSQAFPPSGMRATDRDAIIISPTKPRNPRHFGQS